MHYLEEKNMGYGVHKSAHVMTESFLNCSMAYFFVTMKLDPQNKLAIPAVNEPSNAVAIILYGNRRGFNFLSNV